MINSASFDLVTNKELLDNKSFINGKWVDSTETFEVYNPYNNEVLGKVVKHGEKETNLAINSANHAFKKWKESSPIERSNILMAWYHLIIKNIDDIAYIMTIEQGKPLEDAKNEIAYGANFIQWFAEEAKRIYGDVMPSKDNSGQYVAKKVPVGVTAAITPWNFPMAMITRKISPAIAAGCTIILKPSEDTPFTAIALIKLAEKAGFPTGVVNLVIGSPQEIGKTLTDSNIVKKLSFTGSTEVGKLLYRNCANSVKKLSLELGGNAPFVVFDDANLELASSCLVKSKSRNTGQACTSINRVYVDEKIYDEFLDLLLPKFKKLKIGNGLEAGINQGPLINKKAVEKVQSLINDATKNGAKILYQADNIEQGCFYPPTIIEIPKPNLLIEKEEIFGPVIALYKFDSNKEDELIHRCNNTNYGLASYIFTESRKRVWRVPSALEYGMVGINDVVLASEYTPFGGVKHSGFGREGSKYGIDEYLTIKYFSFGDC